jgi:hypothetical protein
MKKWLSIVVVASWPIWCILSYLGSTTPVAGRRWSEANPGRAAILGLTGALWLTVGVAVLLWKFVVGPLQMARRSNSKANRE